MSYPASHTPVVTDGVEGLLTQIVLAAQDWANTTPDHTPSPADGVEWLLVQAATALQAKAANP